MPMASGCGLPPHIYIYRDNFVHSSPQALYYSLKFDRLAVGTDLSFDFELYDLTLQLLIEKMQRLVQRLQGHRLQQALLIHAIARRKSSNLRRV